MVSVALRPLTVTTTFTAPAAWVGVVAEIDVLVIVPTVAGVPPKVTVAPAAKFVPAIVTTVPPAVEPLAGVTELMVGGAM